MRYWGESADKTHLSWTEGNWRAGNSEQSVQGKESSQYNGQLSSRDRKAVNRAGVGVIDHKPGNINRVNSHV